MLRTLIEIARHELVVALRTRRALMGAALYLGAASIGGLAYARIVRRIEQTAIDVIQSQSGMDSAQAAEAVRLNAESGYQDVLAWFAGVPIDELAPSLVGSPVLPMFLWCSLSFLPFLILLTSFDQLASDLQARSLCYSTLRARRSEILLGKALAHTAIFVVLTAASSVVLLLIAGSAFASGSFSEAVPGMLRIWLLLIPFGITYLGITSFSSVIARQPFSALLLAIGIAALLRMLSWLGGLPEGHPLALLRPLEWMSPAMHQSGFWRAGIAAPAGSALAYAVIGGAFLLAAAAQLERRDL
ncbi:MAG: ABC transporter permease [Deltaproteobacteria bacterium]|nr:ABC transporter permease [Deltaproteobacteria bacterium]MBW2421338.1 ABC transporter permease [Deltaproteobacteria bacterium]